MRDDRYLARGRIDVGALNAFGRLAGEYTMVDNIFTAPLPEGLGEARASRRAKRLDGEAVPVDSSLARLP